MHLSAQEYSSWYNQPTCNQDSQELIVLHMQDDPNCGGDIVLKLKRYLTMKANAQNGVQNKYVSCVIITPDIN